jgi:hypothetical protein
MFCGSGMPDVKLDRNCKYILNDRIINKTKI